MGDLIDIWDRILTRRLREDAEQIEIPEEVADRMWRRMIAKHPELENLMLEIPEEPPPKGFIQRWLARFGFR